MEASTETIKTIVVASHYGYPRDNSGACSRGGGGGDGNRYGDGEIGGRVRGRGRIG